MRLIDMLSMVDEYTDVEVLDSSGLSVGRYDGRDSIDDKYNDLQVLHVEVVNETLVLWVDTTEFDEE